MRLYPLLLALLVIATPVSAQSVRLPPAIIGVWAPEAERCADRAGEISDSRVEVTATSFETFVSMISVRRWQRAGNGFRGRGRVSEEGEGEQPGLMSIELRLLPDGKLWTHREGAEPELFVRCPAGTRVR